MTQIVNDNIIKKPQNKCPAFPPIFRSQEIAEMVGIAYMNLHISLTGVLVFLF